jgi:hypothetical protein
MAHLNECHELLEMVSFFLEHRVIRSARTQPELRHSDPYRVGSPQMTNDVIFPTAQGSNGGGRG